MQDNPVDKELILRQALACSSADECASDGSEVYFGLTGSLKVLDQIVDQRERLAAQAQVLSHYIRDRRPDVYVRMEKSLGKHLQEIMRGNRTPELLLRFAQKAEDSSRRIRLSQLIKQLDLKLTRVSDEVSLYLPQREDAETYQIPIDASNNVEDYKEDKNGLEYLLEDLQEFFHADLEEAMDKGTYVPRATERFLLSRMNYHIIEYLREAEAIDLPDFSDIVYCNEMRAQAHEHYGMELAVRLQIKENPEIGRALDQEFNRLSLISAAEVYRQSGLYPSNPLIVKNKFVDVHKCGNA